MSEGDKPVEELGYEQARDELIDVVRVLEQGGLDLDASLALWERGEKLAKRCEQHLAGAHRRIEKALAEDTENTENSDDTEDSHGADSDGADSDNPGRDSGVGAQAGGPDRPAGD